MQYAFINHLDTAFDIATIVRNVFFATDRFTRDALSILCWGVGRTVNFVTSCQALRLYRQLWQGFLMVCSVTISVLAAIWMLYGRLADSLLPVEQPQPVMLALPAAYEAPVIIEQVVEPRVLITPAPAPIVGLLPAVISAPQVTPDLNELTPQELRKRCQQAGIKWRNAAGKNKHLSKKAMVQQLATIG